MNSPNPYMQPAPVVMPNPIFSPTGTAQMQGQMNAPQQDLNQLSPEALGAALQNYSANDMNMPTKDRDHKDNIFDKIDKATKIYDDYQSGGMDKALGGMMGAKSYANVKPMTDKLASYGNAIGNAAGSAYKSGASSLAGLFK
jgi:hypothetical protein